MKHFPVTKSTRTRIPVYEVICMLAEVTNYASCGRKLQKKNFLANCRRHALITLLIKCLANELSVQLQLINAYL